MTALCLAAGRGTRLRPITEMVPKALCPAGQGSVLLDRAIDRASRVASRVLVNAHHLHEQVVTHVERHHPSAEPVVEDQLLGTGGAVGNVRERLGSDDLLIVNADTVLEAAIEPLVTDWNRRTVRMLVVDDRARPDFEGRWRYVGVALVPNEIAIGITNRPANLSEELFSPAAADGVVELVETNGYFMDCATPFELLQANLELSGGATVVGDGAVLAGVASRSIIMPGARVEPQERLDRVIRTIGGETLYLPDELDRP